MLKQKKWFIIGGSAVLLTLILFFVFRGKGKEKTAITTIVEQGKFENIVTASGELRATNQTELNAPVALRSLNIYQIKIADLVPEGTQVNEGDFVASLDKTEIMSKLSEESLNLQKIESQYKEAQLDTTLTLRLARDELVNLKYGMEEKELEKQQSKYEAPAIQRQAEIEFEKAKRNFEQQSQNYKTKEAQAMTKMQIIGSDLSKIKAKLDALIALMTELEITAPKSGMVIYAREWDGQKRVVGSSVNIWGPTVATLPDLSSMEVVTYVNEIDIKKVKPGLMVDIGLDADPDKKLMGMVKTVASIGEQKPNSDAKVFEVVINVTSKDTTLKPAMTTSCKIMCSSVEQALYIPIEGIYESGISKFVYVKNGNSIQKQEIKTGEANETHIIVLEGLEKGQTIYLTEPEKSDQLELKQLPQPTVSKL